VQFDPGFTILDFDARGTIKVWKRVVLNLAFDYPEKGHSVPHSLALATYGATDTDSKGSLAPHQTAAAQDCHISA
jgi:hypothetical protein